jgi:transposase
MEVIDSEVCDWNRFSSWRKAGSYSGLTGGVSASGQSHNDLSITKVGNRRLRTALIEMAWRLVLHQPNYWLTKKWAPVIGPQAKAHRRSRKKEDRPDHGGTIGMGDVLRTWRKKR